MERQKPFSAWCYQAEEMRLLKLPFREEWGGERNPTPDALERTAFEMEMSLFRNI